MIETLNTVETDFIQRFQSHPLFQQLDLLSEHEFLSILIQRRFLSLSIVNVYEFVIDAITDEASKQTVRLLLNEEYPRNVKGIPLLSHRELLFRDLINLGATRESILKSPESQVTKRIREESFALLKEYIDTQEADYKLIIFLRFWAEVLVSTEYSCLWKRISQKLSGKNLKTKKRSEFYFFHIVHDSRSSDIGEESQLGGLTHSQQLALRLKHLITSNDQLEESIRIEEQVFQLKYDFYTQFLGLL